MFIRHPRKGRQLCLWILGDSRTGKTTWARLIGKHYMIRGVFDAENFHEDVDYYILDDKRPETIEYNELISGTEFTYNGKFCHIMTYEGGARFGKNGIPVIWTSNFHPWDQSDPRKVNNKKVDTEWLKDNVLLVNIGNRKMTLSNDEEDILYELEPDMISIPTCWDEYISQYAAERMRSKSLFIDDFVDGPTSVIKAMHDRRKQRRRERGFDRFRTWLKRRLLQSITQVL